MMLAVQAAEPHPGVMLAVVGKRDAGIEVGLHDRIVALADNGVESPDARWNPCSVT